MYLEPFWYILDVIAELGTIVTLAVSKPRYIINGIFGLHLRVYDPHK